MSTSFDGRRRKCDSEPAGGGPAPPSPAATLPRWSWTCKCAALLPQVPAPLCALPLTLTKSQVSPAQPRPTQVTGTRVLKLHRQTFHFQMAAMLTSRIRCVSAQPPSPCCPVQMFRHLFPAPRVRHLSLSQTAGCLRQRVWQGLQRSQHLSQVQGRVSRRRWDFCLPCPAQARTSHPRAEGKLSPRCQAPLQTSLPPAAPPFPFQGQVPCVPCPCHHGDCSTCPCLAPHFLGLRTHGQAASLSWALATRAKRQLRAKRGLCR